MCTDSHPMKCYRTSELPLVYLTRTSQLYLRTRPFVSFAPSSVVSITMPNRRYGFPSVPLHSGSVESETTLYVIHCTAESLRIAGILCTSSESYWCNAALTVCTLCTASSHAESQRFSVKSVFDILLAVDLLFRSFVCVSQG